MAHYTSLKMDTKTINQTLLKRMIKSDMMPDVGTLDTIIMKERNKILEEHVQHHSIWQNKTTGKWHTKLGKDKHMIVRKERGDLENAIIEFYITDQNLLATFSDVFADWTEYVKRTNSLSMKTINEYTNEFKKFIQPTDFAKKPISEITELDLSQLLIYIVQQRGEKIKAKRFSNVKTVIRSVFNHAKFEMSIDCICVKNIMDDLRFYSNSFEPSFQNDNEQVFKLSEITLLKTHLKDTSNLEELGILLTMETGLRIGELATLKRADYTGTKLLIRRSEHKANFDGNFKYFIDKPKKNKYRSVILSNDAQQIVEKILALHNSEWMFPAASDETDWDRSYNFDKTIRRVCREINIPPRSMHKLRKTYSSCLLTMGVSDKLVQSQLGHSDIRTTHRSYYYDIYDDDAKINELNRIKLGLTPVNP